MLVEPQPAARKSRLRIVATVVAVVAVRIGTVVWIEAPAIWPKPGPSVELLGINRTVNYSGSYSGYVFGTTTSGCPVCPLVIAAGTTVVVNASWIGASPVSSHLHYVFVNWTIQSPYPFLAISYHPGDRPSVYTWHDSLEIGGAGGWEGIPLSIDIPFDSSGLPATGTIFEWINASAF